jgi:hypothetical protein
VAAVLQLCGISVWQFSLNQSEIAVTANPKHQISTTAAPYGFY